MWLNISSISATNFPSVVTVPLADAPCSENCSILAENVSVSPGRTSW